MASSPNDRYHASIGPGAQCRCVKLAYKRAHVPQGRGPCEIQGARCRADSVLLITDHVLTEFASGGLGRMLVQSMAKDLTRRGVKAIEAFGVHDWEPNACMLPADYLLAVGFKTVRPHHRYPRLRLELKTAISWREDVEVALERLLGSMTPEGALRPV